MGIPDCYDFKQERLRDFNVERCNRKFAGKNEMGRPENDK